MVDHAVHVAHIERKHSERQFLVQRSKLNPVGTTRPQSNLVLTHFNTFLTSLHDSLSSLHRRRNRTYLLGCCYLWLAVTEPGQLKQQQVYQLRVLPLQYYLRQHVNEALDPDAQIARERGPLQELLLLELSVVLLLVTLRTEVGYWCASTYILLQVQSLENHAFALFDFGLRAHGRRDR